MAGLYRIVKAATSHAAGVTVTFWSLVRSHSDDGRLRTGQDTGEFGWFGSYASAKEEAERMGLPLKERGA